MNTARWNFRFAVLRKLVLLAAVVALVPACGKKRVTPPNVINGLPAFGATGVSHWPLLVVQFDQDMDPATVNNTNLSIVSDFNGSPFSTWSVTYFPGSREALITPTGSPLTQVGGDPTFGIGATAGLTNTHGTSINGSDQGMVIENIFTIGSATNTFQPTLGTVSATAGGSPGQIDLAWSQSQENGVNISPTYDIYLALTPGGEDFLAGAFLPGRTDATGFTVGAPGNGTLTSGTTYYFIIVVRDTDGNVRVSSELGPVMAP